MKNEIGTGIADAEVLSEICEVIRTTSKADYGKIIEQRATYPWIYHLAEVRSNIVEWLPINREDAVLEVNAECGALSETLLEKADCLTYITDTNLQREIVELRLKKNVPDYEKKDVTGYTGKFADIERELGKYNVIILCGVFGYATLMLAEKADDPYRTLIEFLKRHLKPGGSIVMADGNRLGLKYLAGCQEDHYGGYFNGIHDYAGCEGYRTFTRKEYQKIFTEAGLPELQFYYPYPDYKFPSVIYSDEYLPKEGELNDNRRNIDRDRYMFFNELSAYNTLIAEGLFQEFSNSFLLIASERGTN